MVCIHLQLLPCFLILSRPTSLIKCTITDPATFKEALDHPESSDMFKALRSELQAHASLNMWEATLLPAPRKAISIKRAFKTKIQTTSMDTSKKTRLAV